MSSLIPHDYRYKISSPTPVDKEPKKNRLETPICLICLSNFYDFHTYPTMVPIINTLKQVTLNILRFVPFSLLVALRKQSERNILNKNLLLIQKAATN